MVYKYLFNKIWESMYSNNILFICGSLNQTTMMHKISLHFPDYNCFFSPYYADSFLNSLAQTSILNFSILGGQFRKRTCEYLLQNNLNIDYRGLNNNYDLVFTCSDLIVPKNIRKNKVILVQEGMTDPENFIFYLVKYLHLPRWMASTSTTGLSGHYSFFCIASEGYKNFFMNKGIPENKLVVTGIPNFDNCTEYLDNDFPYKGFLLAATSDMRETFKFERRKKFIKKVVSLSKGKQIVFKLHPNENHKRAIKEINKYSPGALVYTSGKTEEMIANCDILVTRYSSVVYVGMALGKEVHSDFNLEDLKLLMPIQNGGVSAYNIAFAGRKLLQEEVLPEKENMKLKTEFSRVTR